MNPSLANLRTAALAAPMLLLLAPAALAAPRPASAPVGADPSPTLRERVLARLPGCDCESRQELLARRDRIAGAEDLEEARELALEDVKLARRALGVARRLAPFSDDLDRAHERIERYEDDVSHAPSVGAVALRFEDLVRIASSDVVGVDGYYDGGDQVHGGRFGCAYSHGELAAIVLGFVLGIIPGLILLFLLC